MARALLRVYLMSRLRQLGRALVDDNLMNLGAMLAYYAVLALFPMLLFVISLALLVVPHDVLDQGIRMASEAVPPELRTLVVDRMSQLADAADPRFAVVGVVLALWGASRGAIALGQALNDLFQKKESRSWLRRQLVALAMTFGVAIVLLLALGLLVVGPTAGHWLVDRFDLGDSFDTAWGIARWVFAAVLVIALWIVAYRYLPDVHAPLRVFAPGAVVGVLLWLGVSWAFGVYLGEVTSYEVTYGALGTAIAFLTWLWLSNLALLVGAEVNDVLADTRAGHSLASRALAAAET